MRILHLLNQRPEATGSGIYVRAMNRQRRAGFPGPPRRGPGRPSPGRRPTTGPRPFPFSIPSRHIPDWGSLASLGMTREKGVRDDTGKSEESWRIQEIPRRVAPRDDTGVGHGLPRDDTGVGHGLLEMTVSEQVSVIGSSRRPAAALVCACPRSSAVDLYSAHR